MASNLSLQVILSLVDKLTGPAKEAAKSLDALGKEARGASDQLDKPVWTEHPRTLERAADAATGFGGALGGVARAAEDAQGALGTPAWVEHGRSVVKAAEAAHSYRQAVGGVGTAVSAVPITPIKEQAEALEKTTKGAEKLKEAHTAAGAAVGALGGTPLKEHAEQVEKATGKVKEHERAVKSVGAAWEDTAAIGVSFLAAASGASLVAKTFGAGAAAKHVETAMETGTASPEDIKDMQAASLDLTGKFPTQSRQKIEEMMASGRSIVGDTKELIEAMPDLLALKSLWNRERPGSADEGFEQHILRSMELANAIKDPKRRHDMAERLAATAAVAKGSIRPEDYSEYYQYLGSTFSKALDPEFQKGPLMMGLNELHGSTAAVDQRAFYRELLFGRAGVKFLDRWEKWGLVGDKSKVHHKKGHVSSMDPGWVADPELLVSNPYLWSQKHLVPILKDKNPVEQAEIIGAIFPDPGAQTVAGLWTSQQYRADRDTGFVDDFIRKHGLDAYKVWQQKDPGTAAASAGAQGDNILRSGGSTLMPGATTALNALTTALNAEQALTDKAPELNTGIIAGIAAGGAWLAGHVAENPAIIGSALKNYAGPLGALWTAWELGQGAGKMLVSALPEPPAAHEPVRAFGWNLENLWEPRQRDPTDRWHGVPDDVIERSRRSRLVYEGGGFVDDPEAAHARALGGPVRPDAGVTLDQALAPKVDTASLDQAQQKATEAGAAMKAAIEQPLACKVDSGMVDALIAKLHQAQSLIGQINGGVGRMSVPNFTPRSAPLHDGPEAR